MKQRKIAAERKQESIQPLDKIVEMLELPKKTHRDVYMALVERFLLRFPYNINLEAWKQIGQRVGIEPALAKQKVMDMEAAGYVEWKNWCLYPVFHVNGDRDEVVATLKELQAELEKERTAALSSEDMYALLDSICPHTKKQHDNELCEMHRWDECLLCRHRGSMK